MQSMPLPVKLYQPLPVLIGLLKAAELSFFFSFYWLVLFSTERCPAGAKGRSQVTGRRSQATGHRLQKKNITLEGVQALHYNVSLPVRSLVQHSAGFVPFKSLKTSSVDRNEIHSKHIETESVLNPNHYSQCSELKR